MRAATLTTSQQFSQRAYTGDQWLKVMLFFLVAFGLVMMTSASVEIAKTDHGNSFYFLKKQFVFMSIGLVAIGVVMMVPVRLWEKLASLFLLGGLFLLVIVLIPGIGKTVNGSTRWINLGFMGLQASEPAKICLVVFMAAWLSKYHDFFIGTWRGFFMPFFVFAPFLALLLKEPDFGAAVVMMFALGGMLFLAGASLFKLILMGAAAGGGAWYFVTSSTYRMSRVESYLQALSDPFNEAIVYGDGYQLAQALIAFGRGEWFGLGLGNGIQKLYFLPEAHTDFVFAIIAEELGLIGVILLLCAFGVFIWRAFLIGQRCEQNEDRFSAYVAYGVAFIFTGQIIINIGVNTGLLPTKGLTLPFLSYGGSSLIICLVMAGMLLKLDVDNHYSGLSMDGGKRR